MNLSPRKALTSEPKKYIRSVQRSTVCNREKLATTKYPRDQLINLWCDHSTDLGRGLITVGHVRHVKESGFYPEDNGKTLTDINQGNDTIGLTC